MAAMRARRGGAGQKPQGGGGRRRPMSRLAMIKLQAAEALFSGPKAPPQPKRWAAWLAGCVLAAGGAVAGAAWIGGSLVDTREGFARAADGAAHALGFGVRDIDVLGVDGARAQEVEAIALPEARASLWGADPATVKARVEGLDWVAGAQVARLWPNTLRIHVERRTAVAVWRDGGEVRVVDHDGRVADGANPIDYAYLPVVEGAGAGPAAPAIVAALEDAPAVRQRLERLVRVGERRWDLAMRSGLSVALPERGDVEALGRLEQLQGQWRLLDRPLARVDLRHAAHVLVLPADVLAGGPGAPLPSRSRQAQGV